MLALVGSNAINYHSPGFSRNPGDVDWLASFEDFQAWVDAFKPDTVYPADASHFVARHRGSVHEFEMAWPGTTAAELLDMSGTWDLAALHTCRIAPLNVLFTLKQSHRYKRNNPHFLKTHDDWHRMRAMGCTVFDAAWLKRREAETYNYAHPKLNQGKSSFFSGDAVQYVYDHDGLHVCVADGKPPAYTLFSVAGTEVLSSRGKFFQLAEADKLRAVYEEACVLALERSQIPFRGKVEPRASFLIALEKVCTSITSGWFREYAWLNYTAVLARYDALPTADYFLRFVAWESAGRLAKAGVYSGMGKA